MPPAVVSQQFTKKSNLVTGQSDHTLAGSHNKRDNKNLV